MPPEIKDTFLDEEPFPNPFPEPRGWALEWDLSALWPDPVPTQEDPAGSSHSISAQRVQA